MARRCIGDIQDNKQVFLANNKAMESYTFDYVASEDIAQDDIFQKVGKPIVDQCLQGYNGSIFAYGQTGSGKTFTIQGLNFESDQFTEQEKQLRGLLPRCFEYLFHQINKIKNKHNLNTSKGKRSARLSDITNNTFDDNIQDIEFDVKCSYLEIYNENIIDLLDPSQIKVQVREDRERGVYADPCSEEKVVSIQEVMNLIQKGARNRHIACTNMNRESSRSHAVFTATIKTITTKSTNEQIIRTARFHIVDLAGSERCKETGAEGLRLKEASMINKSLTTLGAVINDLADISKSGDQSKVKSKHIRYRDSKLTYLLRDSLGGNAKTVMICNINPHLYALKETRSTLQFAQRAKMIKNQAVVNQENTSAFYWKNKYLELVKFGRSLTAPNLGSNDFNEFSAGLEKDQIDYNLKGSKDKQLLLEAHNQIKYLTQQLKEEVTKREEQSITFNKASEEMQRFKNSLNFRIQLIQSREQKLLEDHFKLTQPSMTEEVRQLKDLIENYKKECDLMKQQVESNPLLAVRHARVKELEIQLQELQKKSSDESLRGILEKVLTYIEKTISYLEQELSDQRIGCGHIYENDRMELDGGARDEIPTPTIRNDLSCLTVARSDEIANIKLKYEDQIEQLKASIMNLESKNRQYLNIIGQKSTSLECSQGVKDSQHMLLHSQRSLLQNPPGLQASQTFRMNVNNTQQIFNVDEYEQLLEDLQSEITEKEKKIELLEEELSSHRLNVDKLTMNSETLLKDNINLETIKMQLESELQVIRAKNQELTEENEDLHNKYEEMEMIRQEKEQVETRVRELEEENSNYQVSYDYFQQQLIPELQGSIEEMKEKFKRQEEDLNRAKQDNLRLKQQRTRDSALEVIEQENARLTAAIKQKEYESNQLNLSLKNVFIKIEEMDRYINQQNCRIQELQEKEMHLSSNVKEIAAQGEAKEKQCQELEEVVRDLEEKLENERSRFQYKLDILSSEKENIIKKHESEIRRYEEENKLIRSDRAEMESHINQLSYQIEKLNKENNELNSKYNELKKKYESFMTVYNQYIEQNQKAMDTIQKYRSTRNEQVTEKDEYIKLLSQQKQELKDQIKSREQKIGAQEAQIRVLQDHHEKYIKEEIQTKIRRLECENVTLNQEREVLTVKIGQLEAKLCLLQDELKRVQGDNENLGKQNNKLLITNNHSAKAQYLNQQRENYNQAKREILQLQEESKSTKKRLEDANTKLMSLYNDIRAFGESLSKVCNSPAQCLKVKGDINTNEYFNILLTIVKESISHSQLNLESHASSSQNFSSSSSSSQDQMAIFKEPFKFQFLNQKPVDNNQENVNHSNQMNNLGLTHKINHQIVFKVPNNQSQNASLISNSSFTQTKLPESRGRQQTIRLNTQQQTTGQPIKLSNLHLSRARDKSNNSGMDIDS